MIVDTAYRVIRVSVRVLESSCMVECTECKPHILLTDIRHGRYELVGLDAKYLYAR